MGDKTFRTWKISKGIDQGAFLVALRMVVEKHSMFRIQFLLDKAALSYVVREPEWLSEEFVGDDFKNWHDFSESGCAQYHLVMRLHTIYNKPDRSVYIFPCKGKTEYSCFQGSEA